MTPDAPNFPNPPCLGLTGLFFSVLPWEQRVAKEMCRRCPWQEPCLAGAIHRDEPCGIWGGLTFEERCSLVGKWSPQARRLARRQRWAAST